MSDMDVDTDTISYTIGAILAIGASILNAFGYTIQKKGHILLKEYNQTHKEQKRLPQERVWIIGFCVYLVGGVMNAVSLFFAPQSLVLPLSAITLVANTILAFKVLGEPFFKADIFGILAVVIGSVLAVLYGPRTSSSADMNELKNRWGDEGFFLFFIVLSAVIVADYFIVRYYEAKNAADSEVTDELKHGSTFLLLSYCLLAGYYGSMAFLFLKAFTEFIGGLFGSKEARIQNAENWYSYFTLIAVVITNVALEYFRQRALSYFHAVYVVPINQVILIVMGTILGGLYFEEFDGMPVTDAILFSVAILMTVIGVFILAFNSGNVAEKTTAKIDHTLKVSLDANTQIHPRLPRLPSIIQTSPSMPITRNITKTVPDFPPPGMAGTIARMHDIQKKMESLHYTKDGKPFYLDPNANGLISIWNGTGWKVASFNNAQGQNGKSQFDLERTKRSQSVPTQSISSIVDQNDLGTISSENLNGNSDHAHFHRKNSSSPALGIEVAVLKESQSLQLSKTSPSKKNSEKEKVQISIQSHIENNGTVRLNESPNDHDMDDNDSEELDEPTPEDNREQTSEDKEESIKL